MRLTLGHPLKGTFGAWLRSLRFDSDFLGKISRFVWRDLVPTVLMLVLLGSLTLVALEILQF